MNTPPPALRFVYADQDVLVLDKPAGLPSTGRVLSDPDCAQHAVIKHCGRMTWAAHQIDAGTTGVLVFVRRKALVPIWQERLRWPNARKRYLAIVHGVPAAAEQVVEAPLGWSGTGDSARYGVCEGGKPSATEVRTLSAAPDGRFALVEATLRTGRTHQVRVHLAHIGHPLVGEPWYAPCALLPRHALHAWRIDLLNDASPAGFVAPLPDDMRGFAAEVGLTLPEGA